MVVTAASQGTTRRTKTAVIDTDIHNALPSGKTLLKYLPSKWHRHHELFGARRGHRGGNYPRSVTGNARTDSWPPSGLPPGSDLPFLREQLLDRYDIEYGVLTPLVGSSGQFNPEYGAALCRAANDWLIAEWIEPEPRLRGSIIVPFEEPDLAAEEIDRLGDHPGFVQVLGMTRTNEPLGKRRYWPMYAAAERHGLPIAMHFGGSTNGPITAAGWVSYYIEDHVGASQVTQSQATSLVFEGVFERFPGLRIVLTEGGFAWLPSLMWRMDRAWERLHDEVPQVRRPPSEYVRAHMRVTTQPMEEPPSARQFLQVLEHFGGDHMIMFATDYPHWDFDAPDLALPFRVPEALERRIFSENARATYRF